MSYGFKDNQLDLGQSFPLSDNIENVYLENAEYNLVKDEYEVIDLNWAKSDGARIRQRIFAVDESNVSAFNGMSLEDTIKQKYNQINTALYRIAKAFGVTKAELQNAIAGGANFKQYAQAFAKLINERSAGAEVRLKTILDKNGYVKVPQLGKFIQPMEGEQSEIAYTKWERDNNAKNEGKRPKRKAQDVTSSDDANDANVEVEETEWYTEDL